MSSFLALYRGPSIGTAKMVAVTAESSLVADFAARILRLPEEPEPDAVMHELERGRRRALELVQDEAEV